MPMERWIGVVAKDVAICGRAVVITVLSRFCMNKAAATMPRRMLWRLRVKGMGFGAVTLWLWRSFTTAPEARQPLRNAHRASPSERSRVKLPRSIFTKTEGAPAYADYDVFRFGSSFPAIAAGPV